MNTIYAIAFILALVDLLLSRKYLPNNFKNNYALNSLIFLISLYILIRLLEYLKRVLVN